MSEVHTSSLPMHSNTSAVQNGSSLCFTFLLVIASDMHLQHGREKEVKIGDFHAVKMSRSDKRDVFSIHSLFSRAARTCLVALALPCEYLAGERRFFVCEFLAEFAKLHVRSSAAVFGLG